MGRLSRRPPEPRDDDEEEVFQEPLKVEDIKTEVKHLESRINKQGYYKVEEPGEGPPTKEKFDRWREWAICVVRNFNREGEYTFSNIEIKSPLVKDILKKVIGEYPGISFNTSKIKLNLPAKSLFHYLPELKEERKALDEESLPRKHLDHLIKFLEDEFSETIAELKNLLPESHITYPLLWTIFKPGRVIYALYQGHACAFSLISGEYNCGQNPNYQLRCTAVNYNGKNFGWEPRNVGIPQFLGSIKISNLSGFPLDFHPEKDLVEQKLIARGQKFEYLRGKKHQHYHGPTPYDICAKIPVYNINGPVMVDAETFNRIETMRAVNIKRFNPSTENKPDEVSHDLDDLVNYNHDDDDDDDDDATANFGTTPRKLKHISLTREQLLLCSPTVHGFALSEKKWCEFFVEHLAPAQYSEKAFDQLVLPEQQKSLVRALVESHVKEADDFDDFIKGKGKGLISILHGPPGVGKTLTAEAVSHVTKRPLYMVSSGELGTDSRELETKLSEILDVASVWKAILLLDEADVFLEKRSTHDLQRNALVSIFLRLLEYYQGILILTTNRVTTFDEAFQSRIHIALKYNNLDKDARKSVWKNFLAKIENIDIDEKGMDILAEHAYNGRQIKNCIKTAKTLADRDGQILRLEHIETVLQIQKDFEFDFKGE